MKSLENEVIGVEEKFVPVDIKFLDSKNRISLGEKIRKRLLSKIRADAFKIFVGEDGDILLRAVVNIPSKEAWVYKNPGVLKQIRKGLEEAKQRKTEKVVDLEDFLKKL